MIAGTYAGLRWGKFLPTARCGPLIPRASGFNGGIVFDCPRFARAFACAGVRLTAYFCLLVRFYATSFACGFFIVIRLAAFWSVVVGRRSCALSFVVVFSIVGSLLYFRFSPVCFCWVRFCIASAGASPSGTH